MKKITQKLIAASLATALCFSFTACSSDNVSEVTVSDETIEIAIVEEELIEDEEPTPEPTPNVEESMPEVAEPDMEDPEVEELISVDDPAEEIITLSGALDSTEWTDLTFILDGTTYTLPFDYSELVAAGWSFDLADYGFENGYYMNSGDKTYALIKLNHEVYDCEMTVGFINNNEELTEINDTQIWSIELESRYSNGACPTLELPGGLTWGATSDDMFAAYGDEGIDEYYAESLNYYDYSYTHDYSKHLDLIIYEDGGLVNFGMSVY